MGDKTINFKGKEITLSQLIKEEKLSQEVAQQALNRIYEEATVVQKSFGETVEEIMRLQKIVKPWRGETIIDVDKASELTGLHEGVFRTNMYKNNCVIDMSLIISMSIGFKLNSIFTQRLLQSAGLDFRLDNPEHIAYLFLLEYCRDSDIVECNKILEQFGLPKTRWLGSKERPPYSKKIK